MMKQLNRIFAAALVAGVLAGCGASPDPVMTAPKSAFDSVRFQGNAPVGGANPMGNGAMNGQQGQAEGAQILDAMRRSLATARGFDAEVKNYSQGHYKTGEKVSELRQSTTQARLIWMKPAKLRAEVIQTSNSLLVGAAMATTDGQNITARAKGILGLIPIHLTASDKKMSTNRNFSFNDNNPNSQLSRLTGPSAQWTVIGQGNVSGVPVKLIAVDNVKRLDREIDREVVMVDPQTMGLRGLAMYTGNQKVVDIQFLKFKWNPSVQANTFSL
jgi:outer membrane lipoprotein-sorting protein